MTHREENKEKAAVPKFGAWDQKEAAGGEFTGYSVVFTKAREKRKQTKVEVPPIDPSTQDKFGHPHAHVTRDDAHAMNAPRPHHSPLHQSAPHPHHRRCHSHSKAPAYDQSHWHSNPPHSTNKEEPNKGIKKLLQCCGGGSKH